MQGRNLPHIFLLNKQDTLSYTKDLSREAMAEREETNRAAS